LIDPLCAALAFEGIPVFLLGARGDTVKRAAAVLEKRHPGLIVAGTRDGYDALRDVVPLLEEMRASGARVLLVGLGSPRQESWVATYLPYSGASVGIGVGGSFDVLAGNVVRAPALFRRLNLEWFYRLLREPSRWRRQLALPLFVWLLLRERLGSIFKRRPVA
jgi:N-acetylglucosaminyldiphosphoundecaprenol N-acetyl-beta-D-mannosaminyltransferase